MAKIITVGAAVQDVFMSQSDALAPVCIDPEHCFTSLELGSKADRFTGSNTGVVNTGVAVEKGFLFSWYILFVFNNCKSFNGIFSFKKSPS